MLFFKTDSSFWTMAGVNYAIIRQGKQFLTDISDQQVIIAAGQVCTSYTSVEQHITSHQQVFRFIIKTKVRG